MSLGLFPAASIVGGPSMSSGMAAQSRFRAMETGIAFAALDYEHRRALPAPAPQLGVSTFGLNQIVLGPGQRGRIHRHRRQEEVYLVLEGTLTLFVEGEEHTLERGRGRARGAGVSGASW